MEIGARFRPDMRYEVRNAKSKRWKRGVQRQGIMESIFCRYPNDDIKLRYFFFFLLLKVEVHKNIICYYNNSCNNNIYQNVYLSYDIFWTCEKNQWNINSNYFYLIDTNIITINNRHNFIGFTLLYIFEICFTWDALIRLIFMQNDV